MQQTNIQLTICHSKTDQLGVGANLQIPASNGVACPFAAMHAHLHMHTSQTGPLFIHFEGQPLTRYQFITILKRCLNAIGVDSSNYIPTHLEWVQLQPLLFKAFTVTSPKGQDDGALMHFVHTFGNLIIPTVSILLTINKIILGPVRVWIVGSSIIKRAAMSAVSRQGGLNLNLENTSVLWQGYSGMKLQHLNTRLSTLLTLEDRPEFLIIHCGANNVGQKTTEELLELLSTTLSRICDMFPTTTIVWSSALPRLAWRFSENVKAMNEIRGRMNREAIKFVTSRGGHYIKNPQFSQKPPTLFDPDGVHLSQLGNDILLNTIKGALQGLLNCGGVGLPD